MKNKLTKELNAINTTMSKLGKRSMDIRQELAAIEAAERANDQVTSFMFKVSTPIPNGICAMVQTNISPIHIENTDQAKALLKQMSGSSPKYIGNTQLLLDYIEDGYVLHSQSYKGLF